METVEDDSRCSSRFALIERNEGTHSFCPYRAQSEIRRHAYVLEESNCVNTRKQQTRVPYRFAETLLQQEFQALVEAIPMMEFAMT